MDDVQRTWEELTGDAVIGFRFAATAEAIDRSIERYFDAVTAFGVAVMEETGHCIEGDDWVLDMGALRRRIEEMDAS